MITLRDAGLADAIRRLSDMRRRRRFETARRKQFERQKHRCRGKQGHASQGAADAQIRSLARRGLLKDPARVRSYRCRSCFSWHVGHVGKEKE